MTGEEPALSEKNQSIVKYHENITFNAGRMCFFVFHFYFQIIFSVSCVCEL